MSEQHEVAGINLAGNEAEVPTMQVMPEAGPVVMDDEKFEEEQSERESAYHDVLSWKGEELQPFSIGRKSLFYSQRLAAGAVGLDQVLGDGSAFLGDAIRLLFLCSHDPVEYRALRARPLLLQERMDDWAEEQLTSDADEQEAVLVALKLFNGSEANQPETVPSGGPGREDELGK